MRRILGDRHAASNELHQAAKGLHAGMYTRCQYCLFPASLQRKRRKPLLDGPSMLPTFETSDEIVIENILSHRLAPYNLTRGELVSLKSPLKPNRIVCKRIIGLPGDVVCVDPTGLKAPSTEHIIVPKGHVWIAGDNTACSIDSRDYGPVSIGLIRGRILAKVFPFNRFQVFTHQGTYVGQGGT